MIVIRDTFYLHFGHWRPVKALLEEARTKNLMPPAKENRAFTDFSGESYRVILEMTYDSLADYEKSLAGMQGGEASMDWYRRFAEHIKRSEREILKAV